MSHKSPHNAPHNEKKHMLTVRIFDAISSLARQYLQKQTGPLLALPQIQEIVTWGSNSVDIRFASVRGTPGRRFQRVP